MLAMLPTVALRRLGGLKHCNKGRAEVGGTFDLHLPGFFEKSAMFGFQLHIFSCKKLLPLPAHKRTHHLWGWGIIKTQGESSWWLFEPDIHL